MENTILVLRKELKMSQEKFGEKLGVTGAAISRIESGDRALTDQMIKAICREYNVNEEWLLSGQGEMFIQIDPDDELAAAVAKMFRDEDEFTRNMFLEISRWTLEEIEIVKQAIKIIKRSNF